MRDTDRIKYDFSLLLNVGFDESDLRWLSGHNDTVLDILDKYYYTPTALENLKNMLAMEFSERTALGLWMAHGDAFMKDEDVFVQDVKKMVNKFGRMNIENYFWNHGEFPVFYYVGYESERKKEVIEEIQERFREERRENMKKLTDIGFDEYEVKNLEEVYTEFCLDLVEEYYMEPVHLKRLKQLLDIGFDETMLLQLYVTDPDKIFDKYDMETLEKRIADIEDMWQGFEMLDMEFYDKLFGDDDTEWEKVVDLLRG